MIYGTLSADSEAPYEALTENDALYRQVTDIIPNFEQVQFLQSVKLFGEN